MTISVCIGSSCHQRSSYAVMKELRSLICESGLQNDVSLSSVFCLGRCANGVTMKIDDEVITGVGLGNLSELFRSKVLNVFA